MRNWLAGAVALFLGFGTSLAASDARADTLAEIKKRKEIVVGVDPGFIPFEMKKPSGAWVGFDVDMISAFAQELGAQARFVDTKWEGIIPSLHTKKFDVIVSGMSITEERAKVVLFSDPYYEAGLTAMISKKHEGKIKDVLTLNDPKFKVATKLGTTSDSYVAKNLAKASVSKFDTESDAATSVTLGKADAFIYDKPFILLFSQKNKAKVAALDQTFTSEAFGVAARKNDKELIAAFNAFLKNWRASGAYDRAIKTHFVDMPWVKDFPELK